MPETSPIKIKPQYIPLKCPICNGFGSVNYGKIVCRGCAGDGYIKVPPQEEEGEEQKDENTR